MFLKRPLVYLLVVFFIHKGRFVVHSCIENSPKTQKNTEQKIRTPVTNRHTISNIIIIYMDDFGYSDVSFKGESTTFL